MVRYQDSSLTEFSAACAQRTPTPGGGAGAGLVAAVGAALGAMAARFSDGRDGNDLSELIEQLDGLRSRCLAAVDEDCEVYGRVAAAYRLPKVGTEQIEARRLAIRDASRDALRLPLELARSCLETLRRLAAALPRIRSTIISDAGACALFLEGALQASVLNVRINLAGLDDPRQALVLTEQSEAILREAHELRTAILSAVQQQL